MRREKENDGRCCHGRDIRSAKERWYVIKVQLKDVGREGEYHPTKRNLGTYLK